VSLTMTSALPSDVIDALLKKEEPRIYDVPKQIGPLRRYDTPKRCCSRGCGSTTYHKVEGIPYCMIHCMIRLNAMLVELGVEQ
jgi:hypothetical protein